MHKRFARRPLLRRLIALAGAYAIALSSLIVGFDVARAAIPASSTIICHSEAGGTAAPPVGQPDGKLCDASCCTGCLMLVAALPSPPTKVAGAPHAVGEPLALAAVMTVGPAAHTTSHQSRAPPHSG